MDVRPFATPASIRARGFNPADDNEADAIAILLWALETGGKGAMNGERAIGLDRRDGHEVGRDPHGMTGEQLTALGQFFNEHGLLRRDSREHQLARALAGKIDGLHFGRGALGNVAMAPFAA
ncbi:MAG: hypothetical protein HQ465_01520 [Rhodospirillales bacterium]|nr:hypothetical protein [Rhodospirillales bacterium]